MGIKIVLTLIAIGIALLIFIIILEDKPRDFTWNVIRLITYVVGLFVSITLMVMSLKLIGI